MGMARGSPLAGGFLLSAILHLAVFGLVGSDWLRPELSPVTIALAVVPPVDAADPAAREAAEEQGPKRRQEPERFGDGLVPAPPPPPGMRRVTLDRTGTAPARTDQAAIGEGIPLDTDDPQYVSYFQIVKAQLFPVWASMGSRIAGEGSVTLRFTIMRNGALGGYEFLSSSGTSDLDRIAVAALQRAAPFYPLPEAGGDALPVIVEFVY